MISFHQNERTPSAHLYSDENGYRLWCFSENRMYGAWNIYKEYIPEVSHYETIAEYPNGGKDVIKIIDEPGQ